MGWGELWDRKQQLAAKVEVFMNECHDNQGRFCEGTVVKPMQKMLNESWGRPEHRRGIEVNRTDVNSSEDGPRIVVPSQANADKASKESNEKAARNKKNSWGFSEAELDAEKAAITKQFNRKGVFDRRDAETKAAAVMQGRVATKGEIKRGREKSTSWGGL